MSNFRPGSPHVILSEWNRDREVTVVIEQNGQIVDIVSGSRLDKVHVVNNDVVKISSNPPFRASDTICNVHETVGGVMSSTVKTTVSAVDTRGTHVKKFTISGDAFNGTHAGHATL